MCMTPKHFVFFLLLLSFILLVPEAMAETSGEEAKNIILDLSKDVLELVVWFIGAILDEFVRAIKAILPDLGLSEG